MPEERLATLYLVRHGRTPLNEQGALRGRIDAPLDDAGVEQARALGRLFATVPLGMVITSPLSRARDTAAAVAGATGAPLVLEEGLLDRDYGPWSGRLQADVEQEYGTLDAAPGVEPADALARRVAEALSTAAAHAREHAVAVVAHDAILRVALGQLVGALGANASQRTGSWDRLDEVAAERWEAIVIDAVPGDGHEP